MSEYNISNTLDECNHTSHISNLNYEFFNELSDRVDTISDNFDKIENTLQEMIDYTEANINNRISYE